MNAAPTDARPLFKHPRLLGAAMLVVLALVTGAALYVRPLSAETSQAQSAAMPVSAAIATSAAL
jgi:hypothetical protein